MDDESGRHIVGTIYTEADIPTDFASEDEEVEFWETHEFSPEFIRAHRIPREQSPYMLLKARLEAEAEVRRSQAEQTA